MRSRGLRAGFPEADGPLADVNPSLHVVTTRVNEKLQRNKAWESWPAQLRKSSIRHLRHVSCTLGQPEPAVPSRMDRSTLPMSQMTLSLEEQIARLQALLEASRQVHSTITVDEVLLQTARILVRELEMDGALFLSPAGTPIVSYGTSPESPFEDCSKFPLLAKDNTLLAELVVRSGDGGELSFYEQDFIEGLVLQAAVALENATLHERDLQWTRVTQDLDAARSIQRSLLPRVMPEIAGFSLAARSITCYEVGGDYLDVLELPDGSRLLVVADVAGKGLASAIVATSFRAAFRSLATQPIPLAEIVSRVGQGHWEEGPEARRRYITAILVRLDAVNSRIEVVNAGHNPGALVRRDRSVHMIEASGTPLGILPFAHYKSELFDFPPGSRLLLYTDGLTEVFCGEDEFGCERLTDTFRVLPTEDAGEMLDAVWSVLERFSTGALQTDDMTALAVCHRLSPAQENVTA